MSQTVAIEQIYMLPGAEPLPVTKDVETGARHAMQVMGVRNWAKDSRESNDFYATDPVAIPALLQVDAFKKRILEPCCGMGHLSKALEEHGHEVESFDIIDRGYGYQRDFLNYETDATDFDIVTNPPYVNCIEFVYKGLSLLKAPGQKMALFLRLLFLEGKTRQILFKKYPPKTVLIAASRVGCAKNGDFANLNTKSICFAWFIWEYGFNGNPEIRWF